ncbi:hypothetical protein RvY_17538 [Ramazzottius varieornatus]|uniref:Ketoreductase domain-containing protein n=1 Tax=Ramazzottius varieornatus TaxID=947166 RepID=A0A1D1W2S8_RAMVA|nr:hypothetical protein RvY_17538 [Ramazzottius varieornatus]
MESFFSGRRVLVTGSGRGIGHGLVCRLAELYAEVFALTRSDSGIETLQRLQLPNVHPVQCDLEDWEATRKTVESIMPVDLLINNAGIFIGKSFLQTKQLSFDRTMSINVKAVINVSQVVAKSMIERQYPGSIVNVSSVAAIRAIEDHSAYSASKAALDAITRVMAVELGAHKIRVNGVNPTVILTDMGRQGWSDPAKANPLLDKIPLHRFGEVEEVVSCILFLLSDQAKFVSGAHLPIDGGLLTR